MLLVGAGTADPELPRPAAGGPGLRRGRRADLRALDAVRQVPRRGFAPGVLPRSHRQAGGAARGDHAWAWSPSSRSPGSGPLSPFAYNEETARNFESVTADGRNISPEYFEAMDAQLIAGPHLHLPGFGRHPAGHHRRRDARQAGLAGRERGRQAAPARPHRRRRTTSRRSWAWWSTCGSTTSPATSCTRSTTRSARARRR